MAGCLRRAEGPDPAQYRRALQRALDEWQSRRRLAAAFAEEDAEIAAQWGEDIMAEPTYRFQCRFCQSRFSLELQRDTHEEQCRLVDAPAARPEAPPPDSSNGRRPITCKKCGVVSPGLTEHNAHLLETHREDTLARRRQLALHRKAEDARIDAGGPAETRICKRCGYRAENFGDYGRHLRQEHPEAYRNHAQGSATPAVPSSGTPGGSPVPSAGNGHCCPTCGGPVPAVTAQLVAELRTLGISEEQAFAASRAARRILAGAAV